MGAADRGEGSHHCFAVCGKFGGARFAGGDTAQSFVISVAELSQCASRQYHRLIGMTGDDSLTVHHIGRSVLSDINAADYIIQGIIFVDTHHIENGFSVLLYRHPHGNAELILKYGGGMCGQIVCFF